MNRRKSYIIFAACLLVILAASVAGLVAMKQLVVMKDAKPLPALTEPAIVVKKSARTLIVFDGETAVKTYTVALGGSPVGDKDVEGDGKTPEGDFYIFGKNPNSKYFLSLGISYPSVKDADRGLKAGLISEQEAQQIRAAIRDTKMPPQKTKLGGEIYIHGGGNLADWTEGCIAVTNADIQELFNAIEPGTRVRIEP
ncbi:MAG: L,D-transpeptidase family protein [Pyrinomonadaceae bacterium]|nr:L,D-transpeptidase family protein [Pyrinomonadaceae bacterium]